MHFYDYKKRRLGLCCNAIVRDDSTGGRFIFGFKKENTMVAVTFTGARTAVPAAPGIKAGKKAKGFFARAFDAIADAQLKRAEREVAMYRHLLPRDFKFDPMNWSGRDGQEPFGGW
jgi:hypothetical protein